jgi:hypothetical protein
MREAVMYVEGSVSRGRFQVPKTLDEFEASFSVYPWFSPEYIAFALVVSSFSTGGCFASAVASTGISSLDGFQGYAYNWFLHEFVYMGCKKGIYKLPGGQGRDAAVDFASPGVKQKMDAAKEKMRSLQADIGGSVPDMTKFFQPKPADM